MNTLFQDLRYAVRSLRNAPGFTAVALLTLALGIGATTAIFSVIEGVLLRPLPYDAPDRLVQVYHANPAEGVERGAFSPQDFRDLERASTQFTGLAAYLFWPGQTGMNLLGAGAPLRLETAYVTPDVFRMLAVPAMMGRHLIARADAPRDDRVVVLSHGLWRSRFGADSTVVGRTVSLSGEPFTVVGVMPGSFRFPSPEADIWVPMSRVTERMIPHRRAIRWMDVIGRLQPGATLESAAREARGIMARLAERYPATNAGWTSARVVRLREVVIGDVRPALLALFGAVGLVLLIACANLANLLLARTTARGREIAVRTALGAGRRRLVGQHLTESALLALIGGVLGVALAWWGVDALVALSAGAIPRASDIGVDVRVIGFGFGVSLLTGLIVGLIPAMRASGTVPHSILKQRGPAGGAGRGRNRVRGLLVATETALAVLLLTGAGLMTRSFLTLTRVDPGFRSENVLTVGIHFPLSPSQSIEQWLVQRRKFLRRVDRRLKALPGVQAVGTSKTVPLHGGGEILDFTLERNDGSMIPARPQGGAYFVTPGYFRALGIPLLRGRTFTEPSQREGRPAVVVNRAYARRYWPDRSAIGQTLRFGSDLVVEIVGVVGNVRMRELSAAPLPVVYVPDSRAPRSSIKLFVRTTGDPAAMVGAVRDAIHEIAPDRPLSNFATMRQVVESETARPRFFTLLLGIFGGVALLLAAIGLYGVIAYSVSQRTREIGIRASLGADRGRVLTKVIGRAMLLVGVGLAVGLAAAFALTRFLSSLLYEVSATDPVTFAAVAVVLAGVALPASYIPARRATRVDPMTALRAE